MSALLSPPTDRVSIDASSCVPDSQHERSLARRRRATANFAGSNDCHHTPVGAHMRFARDYQLLRSHGDQGSPVSRIAREGGDVAAYPLGCDRHFTHPSDPLRHGRHEVEGR